MQITLLTPELKNSITKWKYTEEYAAFNYALQKDGWIDKYCCEANHYCYSVEDGGEIVGLFMFIAKHNNEFRVLINPSHLSKGYGKLITNEALRMGFDELNFSEISLIVRKNHDVAIKLYEKLGFRKDGETLQEVNEEEVAFYKMLKRKTL